MGDNIIHIGFPKTGTTYLQKNVYPRLKGLTYHDYKTSDTLFYDIIFLDALDYEPSKDQRNFAKYLTLEKPQLFSFESLAGAPFIYKGANRSWIPSRLKDVGFDKVIITVRNQIDMIDSMYRQYVVQGGVMRFKDFLDLDEHWKLSIRPFYLGYLEYHKLIDVYVEVFGKQNVLVLAQEELKTNPDGFIDALQEFTGSVEYEKSSTIRSRNESLSNLSINLLRICNHFIFTSQKPNNLISNKISTWIVRRVFALILDPYLLRFLSSKKSFLKPSQKKILIDHYAQSNEKLASKYGIELDLK